MVRRRRRDCAGIVLVATIWPQFMAAQAPVEKSAAGTCAACAPALKMIREHGGESPAFEWVERLHLNQITAARIATDHCKATAKAAEGDTTAKPAACALDVDQLRDFVAKLDGSESAIQEAQQNQERLEAARKGIKEIKGLPGRRADLPPANDCVVCEELWEGLQVMAKVRTGGKTSVDSAAQAQSVLQKARVDSQALCGLRRKLQGASEMGRNFSYYTWTTTGDLLRQILELQPLTELCR